MASSDHNASSLSKEVCSIKISISDVPGHLAEHLTDLFIDQGATSSVIEEYRPEGSPEQKIFAHDTSSSSSPFINTNNNDNYNDNYNDNNNGDNNNNDISAGKMTNPHVWDRCSVIGFFPPELDALDTLVDQSINALDLSTTTIIRNKEYITAQDWEMTIKDSYQPIQISPYLWIVPTWCEIPSAVQQKDEQFEDLQSGNRPRTTYIILEPGLAFGTGDHPTTKLCLQWLSGLALSSMSDADNKSNDTTTTNNNNESNTNTNMLKGCRVMDYGTGSGILAVAALLLGAEEAFGTDVEPLSIKAATQNAILNKVDGSFKAILCRASLNTPEPLAQAGYCNDEDRLFDIVMANILQGPLLDLAPRLASYARPNGLLAVSGIMISQIPAIIERYSEYFEDFEVYKDENWALVTAKKK